LKILTLIFTLTDHASNYISDTISHYYSTYWRGAYSTTTDDVVEPELLIRSQAPTATNGEPVQTIVIGDEPVNQIEQISDDYGMIIDSNNDSDNHGDDNEHFGAQADIQLNLDNYLLLNDDDDREDKSIAE
jgi:hypothetical protein